MKGEVMATLAELVAAFAVAAERYIDPGIFGYLATSVSSRSPASPADGEEEYCAGASAVSFLGELQRRSHLSLRNELVKAGEDLAIALAKHGHKPAVEAIYLAVDNARKDDVAEFQSRWPALEATIKTAATLSAAQPDEGDGTDGAGSTLQEPKLTDEADETKPKAGAGSTPAAKPGEGEGVGLDNQFCFARSGSGYFIAGFGERGHVRKLKGFDHIAMLIKTPGQAVLMRTLSQGEDTISAVDPRTWQPALDKRGKLELYQRLQEVKGELERAKNDRNNVEQQHCEDEIARLERQLTAAVGLGGKDRDLNSEANQLRPAVNANLRRAYKALREAVPPMKELADQFEAAISAEGATYVYRPVRKGPAWSSDLPPEVAR
jgi:hypothetical protein